VAIDGTFDKWDATATMTSPDVEIGVLDIKIQAASVNTGSGMKDGKLKSKDFFRRRARSADRIPLNEDCTDRPRHA
jgi:polyisoprenoid-binding protein YceI